MSKRVGVELVISAVDEVTYKVMAINDKLKKFTEPLNKMNTAFKDLARESGLTKVGEKIGAVGGAFKNFVSETGKGLAVLSGLGYGMFRLVKGSSDFASSLKDTSDRLGVSTDKIQAWNYAAVLSGGSAENVEKSITKMGKAIQEAADGEGDGVGIFRGFGIALRDGKGQIRSMEDILPEFADKFAQIKNPITQNAIALKVFGKEGVKFAQTLKGGSAGLRDFQAAAEKNGAILGVDQLNSLDAFGDRFDALMSQFEVFKAQAIAQIMPQLMVLLQSASDWMNQNKERVGEWAKAFAGDLPKYIEAVGNILRGVGAIVGVLGSVFSALSSVLGETNAAFLILGVTVFGKAILAFISLGSAIASLAVTAIPLLLTGLSLVASGFSALTAAIFAIPVVGWILAIIAVVVALSVAIYKNWGPIKDFMKDLWEGLVGYVTAGADRIMGVIDKVKGAFGFGGAKVQVGASGLPTGPTGAPAGGSAAATAVKGQISTQTNESIVRVDFGNVPRGIRAEVQKSDAPIDLTLGYAMGTM